MKRERSEIYVARRSRRSEAGLRLLKIRIGIQLHHILWSVSDKPRDFAVAGRDEGDLTKLSLAILLE